MITNQHPSPHINCSFFLVVRTFKIYYISSFQIYDTVWVTIVTLLYITSSGLIYFITRRLYIWTPFTHFANPQSPALATNNLFSVFMRWSVLFVCLFWSIYFCYINFRLCQDSSTGFLLRVFFFFIFGHNVILLWVSPMRQLGTWLSESSILVKLVDLVAFEEMLQWLGEFNPLSFQLGEKTWEIKSFILHMYM